MNTREIAMVIWITVAIALVLLERNLRSSLWQLVKALFSVKMLVPAVLYAGILSSLVWLAERVTLWQPALVTETLFWFLFSGVVLFFRVTDAGKDSRFFRRRATETVGLAAFFEFFINLKTMALLWELLLLPVLVLLVGLQVVSASEKQYAAVKRLADVLLALIGAGLVLYTLRDIAVSWGTRDLGLLWRSLVLPIWLTLGALPLIYCLALVSGYELVFMRMRFFTDRRSAPLPAALGVLAGLRANVTDVHGFAGQRARAAVAAGSFLGAKREVERYRDDRQAEIDRQGEKRERLPRYAGVNGMDDEGRRLDQREFEETRNALRWLATCHMGWYRAARQVPARSVGRAPRV